MNQQKVFPVSFLHFTPYKLCVGFLLAVAIGVVGFFCHASIKAIVCIGIEIVLVASIRVQTSQKFPINVLVYGGLILLSSMMALYLTQQVNDATVLHLPLKQIVFGLVIYFILFGVIYAIIGRFRLSIIVGLYMLLFLATLNFYVYQFRGNELIPTDFIGIGTALNVLGQYKLTIPRFVYNSWLLSIFYSFLIMSITPPGKNRCSTACVLNIIVKCIMCVSNMGNSINLYPTFSKRWNME